MTRFSKLSIRILPLIVFLLLGFLHFVDASTLRGQDPAPSKILKILSYNIHHGEGTDGKVDLHRLADVIRKADPDLVALQEVDQATRRTGIVNQVEVLAAQTGLYGQFAKQLDFEGGEYGQAILSKYPIKALQVQWLPGEPERERRIVGIADIQMQANTFRFATTHLHHAQTDIREEQVRELNRLFSQDAQPVILAGDFNATPDSLAMQTLQKQWRVATSETMVTFPAELPDRQLDYVATYPETSWRIVKAEVLDEPIASDHRPFMVQVQWLGK